MTLMTDRVARSLPAGAQDPAPAAAAPAAATAGERELRIDLFRGLALWLIYIDHVSPDVLDWFTIRSYGFSDAAEIFIFISGYTAAFVYGRAMLRFGFVIGTARILRRVWSIYLAHVFLVTIYLAEIYFLATGIGNPLYVQEMGVTDFLNNPGEVLLQTLLLRFRPLNIDVLPLYVVLMFFLPYTLLLMKWRPNVTLALSGMLYFLTWYFDWHLNAYPHSFWAFNPFAWQLLFVFGAWCALGGAPQVAIICSSPITLVVSLAYLAAAFFVTMTWYFPPLGHAIPHWLEKWMYPIDKTDLDILRFAHFLALAAVTVRLVPKGWRGLNSPWLRPLVLCGQHSLNIFCLGVFLAFAGYFVLFETNAGIGLHLLVGFIGIVLMTAVAWLNGWYKSSDAKAKAWRDPEGNADFVGGG